MPTDAEDQVGPGGSDPMDTALTETARSTLLGILREAGVDMDAFEALNDGETPPDQLRVVMGRVWVMHAYINSQYQRRKKELADRQSAFDAVYARAYFEAGAELGPRATEGAKRNWVILNKPECDRSAQHVRHMEYLVGMHKAARKSLEIRVDMLQSINKSVVEELNRLHVHVEG